MMPTSHGSVSQEAEHHPLTAANLRALEPNMTEQHEVLGRFVGGSNSLINRAELQALFRANGVIGEVGAQEPLVAGCLPQQQFAPDPVGLLGAATFGQAAAEPEYGIPHMAALSTEADYPGQYPAEAHWHSQATTSDSWANGLMSPMAADEPLGDQALGNSYGMQLPMSPTKKAYGDLGDSGAGYQAARPRCGRASSEFQRTSMVGQLPAMHTQLQSGMVGGFPLGSIGQIPEGSAAPMGAAGQFVRAAPQFNGPVSRMIGPFPATAAASGGVYSAPMQQQLNGDGGHIVGQLPAIGALPTVYGAAGVYAGQTEERLRRFSAPPVGQAAQLQEARHLLLRNSQSMNSAHMQTAAVPVIGSTEPGRPVIGELPSYSTQVGSPGGAGQGTSLGLSQALLVPRASQPQASSSIGDMYSIAETEPSKYSSAQTFSQNPSDPSKYSSAPTTNLDSVSHAGPSDPLEAPVTESSSLESKPSTKVRVVVGSNGTFIRQAGGHFEYEGGDTRLVSVSNWFSLAALKEALERVVVKPASSRSQSGPPDAMDLKYQLPSDPTLYVDLLDDEDVQLMFDEWADYAEQHKGTSYKLHVYVAWSKECCDDGRKTASISDDIGDAVSSGEVAPAASKDEFCVGQMAGRMEIINPNEISMAKFLGSGGYGEVYLGRWHSSEVAIKCLNPSLFFSGSDGSASKAAMADLMREADLLASLRHPNVVWVYGVVLPKLDTDEDGRLIMEDVDPIPMASGANLGRCSNLRPPAVVTEFMSQGSVKQALARKSDVVAGNMHRVVVAMDAAKGMEYLHQKSIVHFDLKSANLLLGYRDRRAVCKVSDFGLSKQKRDTYVSNVTSQRGTLPWIAPEIIKTPHAVTEKVDVYSFGVVLWELWTGREPYEGLNYHALLHQITLTGGGLRPTLPTSPKWEYEPSPEPAPGWCSLIERCWQEVPEKRPSFAEIVRELKAMGQALRPPRNRQRSFVGASVSSSELDARGIPSGRPGVGSPAKALQPAGTARQSTLRQAIPEDGQAPPQPPGTHPGLLQANGMPANPPSAVKVAPQPAAAPAPATAPAEKVPPAATKATAAEAVSDGPGTPPEKPPTTDNLAREHSEEPSQALTNVANKLGSVDLAGPALSQVPEVKQQVAVAQVGSCGRAVQPPQEQEAVHPPVNEAPISVANKLGGVDLAGPALSQVPEVKQQVAVDQVGSCGPAVQQQQEQEAVQPPFNPFSSAFAYTERMNSAFSSG